MFRARNYSCLYETQMCVVMYLPFPIVNITSNDKCRTLAAAAVSNATQSLTHSLPPVYVYAYQSHRVLRC